MIESIGRNHSRQVDEACFYELGRTFKRIDGELTEQECISLGMMGAVGRSLLDKRKPVSDEEMFLWMKGLIEEFCVKQELEVSFEVKDFPSYEKA